MSNDERSHPTPASRAIRRWETALLLLGCTLIAAGLCAAVRRGPEGHPEPASCVFLR